MMKRSRGRGRRPQNSVNRAYDSNGPDVRVRGTASQVYEKYQALARDAASSGDRVMAENYQQHGEHYYRIMMSQMPTPSNAGAKEMTATKEGAEKESAEKESAEKESAESAPSAAENNESETASEEAAEKEEEKKPRRRGPLGKTTTAAAKKKVTKKEPAE